MISHFQINNRDVLCGNRMNKIRSKTDFWFSNLHNQGVKIICPIVKMTKDISEENNAHWLRFEEKKFINSDQVVDDIYESPSLEVVATFYEKLRTHEFVHPFPFYFPIFAMLVDVAKKYAEIIGIEYTS